MDSLGIGAMPDAKRFGDTGADTLGHISDTVAHLNIPNLQKLGLANLHPLKQVPAVEHPMAYCARLFEKSNGKDTMTGHWEMMGIETKKPFKTFTEHGLSARPDRLPWKKKPAIKSLAIKVPVVPLFLMNWVKRKLQRVI